MRVLDLLTSKLRPPVIRPGTVVRSSLLERLARRDAHPIVSVVAPAGYGKTTLLSQWAERNGQAFAWVSVDEKDNDPKVLLTYVAEARNDWSQAEVLADQARTALRQARLEESYLTPLVCAAHARAAMHRGDVTAVRRELVGAQRLRPLLTYAVPYLAVQARIELARVHLALADSAGARTLVREIEELLRRRPGLGVLDSQARTLHDQVAGEHGSVLPGPSALTAAELRLLPLLATHLSFPQIGEALFLSRNTIKSQAIAIYRKLGVASRTPAVTRARELGLLEA
jgi:LuxR family transcriptional regulator, maltose regulon positive regulatory protein